MTEPPSCPDESPPFTSPEAEPSPSNTPAVTGAGTETEHPAGEDRPRSQAGVVESGPPSVAAEEQRTPEPAASPDDVLLVTSTGSYVKMSSPAVPSSAGDLVVEDPSHAGQETPPQVFLLPEILVESASSASVAEAQEHGASASLQEQQLVASSQDIDPVEPFPEDASRRQDFTASRSHLLSPRRRLSRLSGPAAGHPRSPMFGLLSPRPAVPTPCVFPRSPNTPCGSVSGRRWPLQRPDVFFSGRVRLAEQRLIPGWVLPGPSTQRSTPAYSGCADSAVQRRLALESAGSAETVMIGSSTPINGGGRDTRRLLRLQTRLLCEKNMIQKKSSSPFYC